MGEWRARADRGQTARRRAGMVSGGRAPESRCSLVSLSPLYLIVPRTHSVCSLHWPVPGQWVKAVQSGCSLHPAVQSLALVLIFVE